MKTYIPVALSQFKSAKLKNVLKTKMLKFEITKITQKIQNFLSYLT